MSDEKWWFGYLKTTLKLPRKAIACGPYESFDKAKVERESSKAWNCEVSNLFSASYKDEAEEKAKQYLS